MKIEKISVYQVDLPLEGLFDVRFSGGRTLKTVDSTIVALETDQGITGWGETCPAGPAYLPAFALGARAGIAELAPHLIGHDPRQINHINRIMDQFLLGHPYVKSALDMACWDILGKALEEPLCHLLGGRLNEDLPLLEPIFFGTVEKMIADIESHRQRGIRSFQIKGGSGVENDIERLRAAHAMIQPGEKMTVDANGGWRLHEAIRVVRALKDLDIYVEQPCRAYEDCLKVRRLTDHPFILDESMDSLRSLLRAYQDDAMEAVVIKLAKVGGLSKARLIKDVCVELGLPMRIEDSWGSDFAVCATANLAHAIPADLMLATYGDMTTLKTADGAPQRSGGYLKASTKPGLGVAPRMAVLGDPLAVYGH